MFLFVRLLVFFTFGCPEALASSISKVTSMLRKEQEEEARLAEKLQEQKYQPGAENGKSPLRKWTSQY